MRARARVEKRGEEKRREEKRGKPAARSNKKPPAIPKI
jgi:hypothetical protein